MKCFLLCDKTAAPSCSAGPVLVVFGGVRRPVLLYLPHPVLLHSLAGSVQEGGGLPNSSVSFTKT